MYIVKKKIDLKIIIINLTVIHFVISENTIYPNVKTFKHQHITLISLNRPDDKNTLNVATIDDLRKVISTFENDPSSTIAILYGEGGSFCAGLDPAELFEAPQVYDIEIKNKLLIY